MTEAGDSNSPFRSVPIFCLLCFYSSTTYLLSPSQHALARLTERPFPASMALQAHNLAPLPLGATPHVPVTAQSVSNMDVGSAPVFPSRVAAEALTRSLLPGRPLDLTSNHVMPVPPSSPSSLPSPPPSSYYACYFC